MTLHPELTDKQKTAIELAIKNGYYEYPRKIELKKLAKIMKVSYSTYQAHLRKAEKSLIPFFFEKSK
jgi:predicted DNA binding protein